MSSPQSHLYYGPPNGGKTWALVTSFWDPDKKVQTRDGRLLLFGREDNPALLEPVPANLIKRFVSPLESPLKFMEDFTAYMMAVCAQARKGKGVEVLCLDGFSEWNSIFMLEHTKAFGSSDRWAGWRAAKDQFLGAIQMLNPNELKAHVLATARVAAKKHDVKSSSGDLIVEGDPDWMESKYFPAMDGWMRDNLSYYFNLVSFVDSDPGPVLNPTTGKPEDGTHHKYYMKTSAQFLVKNVWEREWQLAGMPAYLTNPRFDDILGKIEEAKLKAAAVLAGRTK